jgi:hypothetical protein
LLEQREQIGCSRFHRRQSRTGVTPVEKIGIWRSGRAGSPSRPHGGFGETALPFNKPTPAPPHPAPTDYSQHMGSLLLGYGDA